MNMIKKLGLSSVVLLAVTMAMFAMAAMADGAQVVKSETQVVADLGILVGDGAGLSEEYLNKDTTRIQAAIMFLRLKGLEADASAFEGKANFSDAKLVWSGGQTILAYLKANPQLGWQGMGNGAFDPLSGITAQQYYKVMLEALGYTQGMDFEYADVFTFAAKNGLVKVADVKTFKNINVATATIEALNAAMHTGGKTLASELSESTKLDATKLEALQYAKLELKHSAVAGHYFTDAKGMTLYYFTKDAADVNSCVGGCLAAWPIYYAEKLIVPAGLDAADFGSFTRADGKMQSTYKGWPLYYYAKDIKAGDTVGDGVGKVWYVIQSPMTLAVGTSATLGNYLTDAKGMTLYYFDKDTKDVSNCTGGCLAKWPAYYSADITVPAGLKAEDFATITRTDGAKQTTFKGFPLYYWVNDLKRGDTLGQDVGKVWFVVDPIKFNGTTAVAPVAEQPAAEKPAADKPAAKTYTIDIAGFKFSEDVLTVEVGSTVTWTNKDSVKHNAQAVDDSFALPLLAQGESGSFTFTKAGEYTYFCLPHKDYMTAKIIVK
jgi:predicted lipoprotein with Yx(FWY)xxD motif/plastocyanin